MVQVLWSAVLSNKIKYSNNDCCSCEYRMNSWCGYFTLKNFMKNLMRKKNRWKLKKAIWWVNTAYQPIWGGSAGYWRPVDSQRGSVRLYIIQALVHFLAKILPRNVSASKFRRHSVLVPRYSGADVLTLIYFSAQTFVHQNLVIWLKIYVVVNRVEYFYAWIYVYSFRCDC